MATNQFTLVVFVTYTNNGLMYITYVEATCQNFWSKELVKSVVWYSHLSFHCFYKAFFYSFLKTLWNAFAICDFLSAVFLLGNMPVFGSLFKQTSSVTIGKYCWLLPGHISWSRKQNYSTTTPVYFDWMTSLSLSSSFRCWSNYWWYASREYNWIGMDFKTLQNTHYLLGSNPITVEGYICINSNRVCTSKIF